jgi:DNA-directed RNA polymerase subunit RPC12/RpoP
MEKEHDMRCWNCGKRILDTAKVCRFCEATVEAEPT